MGPLTVEDFLYSLSRTPAPRRFQRLQQDLSQYSSFPEHDLLEWPSLNESNIINNAVNIVQEPERPQLKSQEVQPHPNESAIVDFCSTTSELDSLERDILNLEVNNPVTPNQSNSDDESSPSNPNEDSGPEFTDFTGIASEEENHSEPKPRPKKKVRLVTYKARKSESSSLNSRKALACKAKKKTTGTNVRNRHLPTEDELTVVGDREFGRRSSSQFDQRSETEDLVSSVGSLTPLSKTPRTAMRSRIPRKPLSALKDDILRDSTFVDGIDLSEFKISRKRSSSRRLRGHANLASSHSDGFRGIEAQPTGITMSIRRKISTRRAGITRIQFFNHLNIVSEREFGVETLDTEVAHSSEIQTTTIKPDVPTQDIQQILPLQGRHAIVEENSGEENGRISASPRPQDPQVTSQSEVGEVSSTNPKVAKLQSTQRNIIAKKPGILEQLQMVSAPSGTFADFDFEKYYEEDGEDGGRIVLSPTQQGNKNRFSDTESDKDGLGTVSSDKIYDGSTENSPHSSEDEVNEGGHLQSDDECDADSEGDVRSYDSSGDSKSENSQRDTPYESSSQNSLSQHASFISQVDTTEHAFGETKVTFKQEGLNAVRGTNEMIWRPRILKRTKRLDEVGEAIDDRSSAEDNVISIRSPEIPESQAQQFKNERVPPLPEIPDSQSGDDEQIKRPRSTCWILNRPRQLAFPTTRTDTRPDTHKGDSDDMAF